MSFDNLILIESIACSAISIGIAVWLPFKLRSMRRERDREWAQRDQDAEERWHARHPGIWPCSRYCTWSDQSTKELKSV